MTTSAVHLMGNYINQWPEEESDDEDSCCSEDHDDYSDLELDEDEFSVEEFEEAPKG